jgi:hypothetical protein
MICTLLINKRHLLLKKMGIYKFISIFFLGINMDCYSKKNKAKILLGNKIKIIRTIKTIYNKINI